MGLLFRRMRVRQSWSIMALVSVHSVAVVCSWQRNRSILWAILAGIFQTGSM